MRKPSRDKPNWREYDRTDPRCENRAIQPPRVRMRVRPALNQSLSGRDQTKQETDAENGLGAEAE